MLNRKTTKDLDIEIEEWRAQKRKKVEIILSPGENEYLIEQGHLTKPILYKIKNASDLDEKNCPKFVKNKYCHTRKQFFKLKKSEKKLLDSFGIEYEALGYIVYL